MPLAITDAVQSRYPEIKALIQRNIGGAGELLEKALDLKSKGKTELARTILKQGAIQFIRSNDFASGATLASAYYRTFQTDKEKYFAALNLLKSVGHLSPDCESEVLVGIAGDKKSTHPFRREIIAIVEPLKFANQVRQETRIEEAALKKEYLARHVIELRNDASYSRRHAPQDTKHIF